MRSRVRRASEKALAVAGLLLLLAACEGGVKFQVPSYGFDDTYIPFGRD
jgi:hypothetical protein